MVCAFLMVGSALAGCADDADSSNSGDSTSTEITYDITILDWISSTAVEGVEVCFNTEAAHCITTDADGLASTTGLVAAGDRLQVRGDKDGYFPFLFEIDPEYHNAMPSTAFSWVIADNNIIGQLIDSLGTPVNDTKGQFTVVVNGPADDAGDRTAVAGAVVTTTATVEQGPKYYNPTTEFANGIFAADATATTAAGLVSYFNVDPGEVAVTVELDGHICGPAISGVASDSASATSMVEMGRVTYFTIACDVDPNAPAAQGVEGTTIFQISDWLEETALENVALCSSLEGTDCVLTDADGLASITGTFVPGELIELRADKDGYFPFLVEGLVPPVPEFSSEPVTWVMAPTPIVDLIVQSLGTTVDASKGHVTIVVNTLDDNGEFVPLIGAEVSTGATVETGPHYFNAGGTLATEPGITEGGGAIFFNVDAGATEIEVTMDGYTCSAAVSGIPGPTGGVGINVEASRVSYAGAFCTAD